VDFLYFVDGGEIVVNDDNVFLRRDPGDRIEYLNVICKIMNKILMPFERNGNIWTWISRVNGGEIVGVINIKYTLLLNNIIMVRAIIIDKLQFLIILK